MATVSKISVSFFQLFILLSFKFIDAQSTNRKVDRGWERLTGFNHSQDRLTIAKNAMENFNRALNTLTNNVDFQPICLSVGSFGFRNKILERVTEYLTERTFNYYQFDLEKFDTQESKKLQSGLTWIIVVDEYKTLESHIRGDVDFWRAAKQFFILFVDETAHELSNYWLDIFRTLWNRHRVCKVLIASIHENFKHLYKYMPFEKVGDEFGIVQRLDVEYTSNRLVIENRAIGSTMKDEKPLRQVNFKEGSSINFENFLNFNGYPIHVTVFRSLMMNVTTDKDNQTSYTMLDANVMKLVEERLRSKFHIKVIDSKKDGDPFMEALETLKGEGESDIVFTAYFTKLYLKKFVFTTSILDDKVCLIGPSSEPIPKFFMPLLPFSNELWFLLLLYNLVIAALWLLLQRIQLTFSGESKITNADPIDIEIRVLTYGISRDSGIDPRLCNSEPYIEPRKIHPWIVRSVDLLTLASYPLYGGKTCTERAFLFGTLFFGLIVIGLYQSYLVSSLSKPIFYPELNTLSDVVKSNRTIITKYQNLQQDTFTQGTPDSERLRKMIEVTASLNKTLDMVAYRGFVSIGRYSSFQLENLTDYYNKATNKLLLHMVEECPATYHLAFPARLHSPYVHRIDSLLLRMQQSGLIDKWYGDMILEVKVQAAKSMPSQSDERVKLTLEHLSMTFIGLGIGLFTSTIVFLGELHYARRLHCLTCYKNPSTL